MADDIQHMQPDDQGVIVPDTEQKQNFVKGLVATGQAARPLPDGTLPPGATHEIIGETPSGLPIVRRRRFSAF
jgi:hypothetical protein